MLHLRSESRVKYYEERNRPPSSLGPSMIPYYLCTGLGEYWNKRSSLSGLLVVECPGLCVGARPGVDTRVRNGRKL